MAHLIDKSALVAEIDKRLHQLTDAAFDSMIGRNLIEIKDFLDTLEVKEVQEEPVSEDLEEVAHQYYKPNDTFMDGFKKSANWQKQQMMKDAIETTIVDDWQYGKDQDHTTIPAIHQRIDGCKVGDKVKVIIIKED